jgi:AraC-like DNA-binding protein
MPEIREVSTVGIEPSRRLDYWQEGARVIGGMQSTAMDSGDFEAWAKATVLDTLKFGRLAVTASEARWTPALIRQAGDDFLRLILQSRGTAEVEQGDVRATLRPGEWVLLRASHPHVIRCGEPIEEVVIIIPRSGIVPRLFDSTRRLMGANPVSGDLAKTFFRFADFMLDDVGGDSTLADSHFERAGLTLVAALLEERLGGQASCTSRERWVERVRAYIDNNLSDPGLSVRTIADALSVSTRYIHSLFQGGQGVHSYIWESRLQRCFQDLAKRQPIRSNITTIAMSHGFSCPAHFSKAFRSRYGISPRELRNRSIAS